MLLIVFTCGSQDDPFKHGRILSFNIPAPDPDDASQVWNPVQYILQWDIVPGARYRLFSSGQAINKSYYTRDTVETNWSIVTLTNDGFGPFYPSRSNPNEQGPLITWTNLTTGEIRTSRAPPTNAWSFDFLTNSQTVLQGTSDAGIRWYVVAVLNNTNMYRTSNIVSWPTNWNTVSTNNFTIQLNRMPIGPPMFINHNPPKRPQSVIGITE